MLLPAPAAPVQSVSASVNWHSEPEPDSATCHKHPDTFLNAALALISIPPEGLQVFKQENINLLDYDVQGRLTNSY